MERLQSQRPLQILGWVVPLASLLLLACGCGGKSSSNVRSIAFLSSAALDGSNAANTNSTVNIWLAKTDGSPPVPLTRLTAAGASSFSLSWSPDGTRLAFLSGRALDGSDGANTNSTVNLWVINADGSDGSNVTRLTQLTGAGIALGRPAWSPDGSKLAFESNRALDGSDTVDTNSNLNIWLINADGSNAAPVTKLSAMNVNSAAASWSPDGKKLAFLSLGALDGSDALNPATNIWTSNPDGSGVAPMTTLTAANVNVLTASWSPDGKKLVFASDRALDGSNAGNPSGSLNVWTINADGSGAVPLTRLGAAFGTFAALPSWSPDSSKLAYVSNRALDGSNSFGSDAVWLITADGSNTFAVAALPTAAEGLPQPQWSPDGKSIAYSSSLAVDGTDSMNAFRSNVWLLSADGFLASPLTKFPGPPLSFDPAWRP